MYNFFHNRHFHNVYLFGDPFIVFHNMYFCELLETPTIIESVMGHFYIIEYNITTVHPPGPLRLLNEM